MIGAAIGGAVAGGLTRKALMPDDPFGMNSQMQGLSSSLAGTGGGTSNATENAQLSGTGADQLVQNRANSMIMNSMGRSAQAALNARVFGGVSSILSPNRVPSGAARGKEARSYLDNMYPELSAWDKAGVNAPDFTGAEAQQKQENKLLDKQLTNQKEIASMNNQTQKEIAGLQSATTLKTNQETLNIQRERLPFEIKRMQAETARTLENEQLTVVQKSNAIVDNAIKLYEKEGKEIDNKTKAEMLKQVTYQVEKADTTNSPVGKVIEDIKSTLKSMLPSDETIEQAKSSTAQKWQGLQSYYNRK